jgi:hypothetical protein
MHFSRLLNANDAQLAQTLGAVHKTLDGQSHDVQILGEIAERVANLKRALSLDPTDTTSHELYVSLRQRVRQDNERLGRSIEMQLAKRHRGLSVLSNQSTRKPNVLCPSFHE